MERICGLTPGKRDPLVSLWKEFHAGESDEARFAKAIDRCMSVPLNLNNNGGSWVENAASMSRSSTECGRRSREAVLNSGSI
jgi:putative hydrolase of HD superfamily